MLNPVKSSALPLWFLVGIVIAEMITVKISTKINTIAFRIVIVRMVNVKKSLF